MKHAAILMTLTFLAGCSPPQAIPERPESVQTVVSRFHSLDLKPGMNREDVEKQVASLLNQQQQYSPYGNNLRGGTVQYADGDWILEVKYNAGTPAPWVENPDGSMQHYPPVDETLLEYNISNIPNRVRAGV